ncbi:family 1 encapsulin nanocompartment shell protein [Saccharopolyspora cebuensis]|uniref:family 1 encapsulin nanocompartment shell protein n=1 Tax=Saccharopolyspora cebuensis TaxID=418759 RepID=UPI0031E943D4
MNHLLRDLAPLSDTAWAAIDSEVAERLKPHLAARRLADFHGPHGWQHDASGLGRIATLSGPPAGEVGEGTTTRQRQVLPLVEVRVPFTLSRAEIADAERGALDLDLDAARQAAERAARIENRAVFHGWEEACMTGITQASSHPASALGEDADDYPRVAARAVDTLRSAGIEGPYGLVIDPEGYTHIVETTEHGGYLLMDHLRRVLGGGSVVRSPGIDGAVVMSLRGGDFRLEVGQDLSVGYERHDDTAVTFYLEESFTFRVTEPDAAIALTR